MVIIKRIKSELKKIRSFLVFYSFWMCKYQGSRAHVSKTILVIRLDAIGDCILWLDQAKEFKKKYPNHKIVLLYNKAWYDIAERLPWFDECISFDRSKICEKKYYRQVLAHINIYTYEKVFSPVYSRDFFTVDWFVHNVHALEKIGYEGDYQNNRDIALRNLYCSRNMNSLNMKKKADGWYTMMVPNDPSMEMELQKNAHFIRQTINSSFSSSLPYIPFALQFPKELCNLSYTILFLGASTENKMWPIDKFVEIVPFLSDTTIILCGSEKERNVANKFKALYDGNKRILDMTGKTSLIDLIGVISQASLVISNDTSASHIAVATRTRSICLLGGGHYGRFHPYQVENIKEEDRQYLPKVVVSSDQSCFKCNFSCKFPLQNNRWKCINEIHVESVVEAIKTYERSRIFIGQDLIFDKNI